MCSGFGRLIAVATVVALLVVYSNAMADTVVLTPVKDNSLFESATGAVSNGSGEGLFSGRTGVETNIRAVLAFDLSAIPSGSTITGASLTLHVTLHPQCPPACGVDLVHTHTLHRVLGDWGEAGSNAPGGTGAPAHPGDATWLHRFFDTDFWTNPGGDFDPNSSADALVEITGTTPTWSSAQMVADVQSWLDQPALNFGWLLLGNEDQTFTAKRFASREYVEPSLRPQLTIEYTPPPGICPADIAPPGGDGAVGVPDLLAVINAWGSCAQPCPPRCTADINADCSVGVPDLLAVINNWGSCQ